ncbi:CPBP family intramembrane glutamic endopeptidase [Thermostichus vulcanus]|uniref:CPBP family intramembrane metalloprotease n=1 Tax=Thermostichus vulcanus str. 'Rupite' TaxID=2813851 RepID=A0ABT0CBN4_THEVL|nr:CPBP family intramembrane glutamic endopeptidase [Thermostichus vulcanus]MCJ2543197.1 CPBP family intramembrane metalloprotease [Thermostichus vulcanus str. 'Rupite']
MTLQTHPLTREQVLSAMIATSGGLALLAGLWSWLGSLSVPFSWDPLALLWGVGLGFGVVLMSELVYRLWPDYRRAARTYLQLIVDPLQWGDVFWLGLLPGWSEEWLFRGVLVSVWVAGPLGWAGGILCSSLLFGVLHWLEWRGWPYALWASGVGILLGIGLWLSGNLLVTIVAHVLINWFAALWWKYRQCTSEQ